MIEHLLKENQHSGLCLAITGRRTRDECIITVTDDGVGVRSEGPPFVLKRSYRGTRETKGTGLGLSIVERAVEAHGGTVELESEPGCARCLRSGCRCGGE